LLHWMNSFGRSLVRLYSAKKGVSPGINFRFWP
jgi:hypothetical protein